MCWWLAEARGESPQHWPRRGLADTVAMDLPVMPPVAPMLAKPVAQLPEGRYSFEPKWDGFRTVVFRDGDEVELGSRNERPLTRYFPELVAAVRAQLPAATVPMQVSVPSLTLTFPVGVPPADVTV